MSLNRLIARLAVVHALNNYLQEPWPTLAGPNIFDSKIEPVEDMKLDRAFPLVVVYTDYDKDHWNKAGKTHSDRFLSVTIETLIVQMAQEPAEGEYKLDCPMTDSEIEMSLDILEVQISRALSSGNAASDAFNYLCPNLHSATSRRGATIDGGQRLAARQITLEMKAIRDNVAGVIPPQVEAFLTEMGAHDDYKDRIEDIRAFMTAQHSGTDFDRAVRAFGYGRDLAPLLGVPPTPHVILPQNLTFELTGPPP